MLVNVILWNSLAHWQKIALQLAQTNLLQLLEKILDADHIFTRLAQAFALRIHRVSQVLQAWVSPRTPISTKDKYYLEIFHLLPVYLLQLWLKPRWWNNRKWNSEIWKTYLSCVPLHIWIHWSLDFQVSKLAQNPETCSPQDAHPELNNRIFWGIGGKSPSPTNLLNGILLPT